MLILASIIEQRLINIFIVDTILVRKSIGIDITDLFPIAAALLFNTFISAFRAEIIEGSWEDGMSA